MTLVQLLGQGKSLKMAHDMSKMSQVGEFSSIFRAQCKLWQLGLSILAVQIRYYLHM